MSSAYSQARHMFLAIEGDVASADEAILLCGHALESAGCVTSDFADECIKRELDYPTGLPTDIPVALPHCQSDAILRSTLCYLRLRNKVKFYRMDDDEDWILTRHVFNLAILPGNHLEFLSKTISLLQNEDVMRQLEVMDIEMVPAFLAQQFEC